MPQIAKEIRSMSPRPSLAVAVLALGGLVAPAWADDFVPLVKGDDVNAFELVAIGPDTIKIEDGEILVKGKPNGYFATRESYKNYILKFDWKYERPSDLVSDAAFRGNSGLLLHIQEPHKVWPRSIELQLQNSNAGAIIPIGGAKCQRTMLAPPARAVKPVGQWNEEEVTCREGTIACKINGVEVSRGTEATVQGGPIGWQSEGAPIRFRNLAIKKLD
jgi:hypothetical protein